MHPQINLIEAAMQVAMNEAKEGELHTNLRLAVSDHLGISPDHPDWKDVTPHVDVHKYADNVYNALEDHVHDKHISDAGNPSTQERYPEISKMHERNSFLETVQKLHGQLTATKKDIKEQMLPTGTIARMGKRYTDIQKSRTWDDALGELPVDFNKQFPTLAAARQSSPDDRNMSTTYPTPEFKHEVAKYFSTGWAERNREASGDMPAWGRAIMRKKGKRRVMTPYQGGPDKSKNPFSYLDKQKVGKKKDIEEQTMHPQRNLIESAMQVAMNETLGSDLGQVMEFGKNPENKIKELHRYATNHADLHSQRIEPIHKNLIKKHENGVYDTEKAHTAFVYAAKDAAERYHTQFGLSSGNALSLDDKNTIHGVASKMRDEFEDGIESGRIRPFRM